MTHDKRLLEQARMEREMREALGLEPKKARSNTEIARPSRVIVHLAVRASWGGHLKTFTYVHPGFSVTEARIEAGKAARKAGWVVSHYLDEEVH